MSESAALLTPPGVAAYPHLFVAVLPKKAKSTDAPKFSTAILFDEAAMATPEWKAVMDAVVACGIGKWGEAKFRAMLNEDSVNLPFRKDVTSKGYPDTFKRFINITSGAAYPPAVVDRRGVAIKDTRAIISGTPIRASLSTRAYGGPGTDYKAGIALDMRNIQKLGEGAPLALGGASDPKADFGAPLDPEPAAGAGGDLADLMG
jgi:hypothetical protein